MPRKSLTLSTFRVAILTALALSTTAGIPAAIASSYAIEVRYAETGELLPAPELTSLELYRDGALVETVEPYGGTYLFDNLEPDHTYQVDAYGTYMWLASVSRFIGPDEASSDVITAPYLGTLTVRVFYADGITPLDNAQVEVRSHGDVAWRSGISASDGWVSWGGSPCAYLFPNRLPGEQWTVHTFREGLGVAYPIELQIVEQGEVTISITTSVPYETAPATPTPINPADDAVITTLTPTFHWSPFQHGGDEQTQSGYQLRVRCDEYAAWNFDTPTDWGILPAGWMEDSSVGSNPTYRVTTFDGEGCLHLVTLGGTSDRIKALTEGTYATGTYDWRVYVPAIDEPGASNVIAAWLYSPQSGGDDYVREIDFEIGYGSEAQRDAYSIPADKLMVYMTVQRDYGTGTNYSTHAIPIDPDAWYELRLILAQTATGQYQISWLVKKEGAATFSVGRPDYVCGYGPATTAFHVACSLENDASLWLGDHIPVADKHTHFDFVTITNVPVYDTGFVPSASDDSHTYQPGQYTGFDQTVGSLRVSEPLVYDQHYHWHVRYRDTGGDWSEWSSDIPTEHQDFYTTAGPDSDGDGVPDAQDACPNTIPGVSVDAAGCPPYVPGDADRDGDIDTEDVGRFATCLSGPDNPPALACEALDLNADGDIDQLDFAILQSCFSGTNTPADPSCPE